MAEHYFTEEPESELVKKTIVIEVAGHKIGLQTASGVFSFGRPDNGTMALIKYMQLPTNGRVLDIGCGYGIVGISAAKLSKCEVTMGDVNKRAVLLARGNAKRNRVRAKVVQSDLFEKIPGRFDCILSNPPISAGKSLVFRLIEEAHSHLNDGGTFQAVCRGSKGGKSIEQHMMEVFQNAETIGRQSGFHVYKSVKQK